MTTQTIKTSHTGSLLIIQLDRPAALNALNLDMLKQLKTILVDAFADDQVNSIWLESSTEKAFCAGGDVKALVQDIDQHALAIERSAIGKTYFSLEYGIDLLIEQSPKPIVVYAQGITFGGGWGLFAGANLRLAGPGARFSMPEIQIGFYPDVGAANFLQKTDWKIGTFVGLSGVVLSAKEAMALDYVDSLVTTDYADTLKQQLAEGIDVIELDIDSAEPGIDDIHDHWHEAMALLPDDAALNDWINIAEQHPEFEPFMRAEQNWQTGSPWSVAFTWHYFQRLRHASRAKALELDTKVGAFFCTHDDFYEGVHAKLIDKNRSPNWLYPHVESVPLDDILKAID